MPMLLDDLASLSRLLDEAMALDAPARDAWLAALPAAQAHLRDALRDMLAEHDAPGSADPFRLDGPRLDDASTDVGPGDAFGAYRLVRELARGGMGAVWLAERVDGQVKRAVAVKMPLLRVTSAVERERFARERDVLATLDHPRIARLFDAGIAPSGQPFIVLEYVDGRPVTDHCDARQLGLRARLELFLQVLDAVDHAHKHLVVHRDIKPSNLLVDAQGCPKLLDFGVAKLLDDPDLAPERAQLTQQAGCAATPRYAAPEQLENGRITTATDVYALGVLLYELVAGASPYGSAPQTLPQWMDAVLHHEPRRPSRIPLDDGAVAARGAGSAARWQAAVAGDLDTIVMKALRKAPNQRYGSVDRFGDDLRRFLANQPVAARRPTLAYLAALFVRRHRAATALSIAGAAVVAAAAGIAWEQHLDAVASDHRTAEVRDFMIDMLEDAEPDEVHPTNEVTGRQMIQSAIARARERFAAQPALRGELLGELGRMQRNLGDPESADAAAAEANELLERAAPDDDPILNDSRARLAQVAFDNGDLPRARQLAERAVAACDRAGPACARARAVASGVLTDLAQRQGDLPTALAHARDDVHACEIGYGPKHAETALAWDRVAVTARNQGLLDEAQDAVAHAQSIAATTTLRAIDRRALLRTKGVIDYDFGRYEAARSTFAALVVQPDRSWQATNLRLLAQALLAQGLGESAQQAAEAALGQVSAQRPGPELMWSHQARARARALVFGAAAADAVAEMDGVVDGLVRLGYPPTSKEMLRARLYRTEVLARVGRAPAALAELAALTSTLRHVPPGQALELAQALDLQGTLDRSLGDVAGARAAHREASDLLRGHLPPNHPWIARNALYAALAEGAGPARFTELAARVALELPPRSAWRAALERCRAPGAASAGDPAGCALQL